MYKKILLSTITGCVLTLMACGRDDSATPCGAKDYNSPSLYVSGNNVYTSFYSKDKYEDTSAATCTDSTKSYNLMFGKSTDGGETWSSRIVKQGITPTTTPSLLSHQSIAVDGSGRIFISYVDNSNILYCAISTDGGITFSFVQAETTSGVTASTHAIAVDSANNVYIFYTASLSGTVNLKLAKSINNGATWTTATIDSTAEAGYWPSVSIDSNNTIHLSYYYHSTSGGLKYAKSLNLGASWTLVNIKVGDSAMSGPLSSIAATSGAVYLSFYDPNGSLAGGAENPDGTIKITKSLDDGVTWSTPVTIDSTAYTGKAPALAVSGNYVYVVYGYYQTDKKIKFASSTDGATTFTVAASEIATDSVLTQNITDLAFVSTSMSLYNLNGTNKLYLIYVGTSGQNIIFKTSTDGGATWTIKTLSL